VYYRDGVTVWTQRDGDDSDIYVADERGMRALTSDRARDESPVVSGGRVFWISDGDVRMADLASDAVSTLVEGTCGALSTDAGMLAFTCNTEADGLGMGSELWFFDGHEAKVVSSSEGMILAVTLDAGRIAWAQFGAEADLCQFAVGELMLLADVSLDPVVVAPVGSGCWCCDALWPASHVSLEGDVLGWNYALTEPTDPFPLPGSEVAYALLRDRRVCP
jgi:hypothetical protein